VAVEAAAVEVFRFPELPAPLAASAS
jgi:hypothetical protein